MKKFRIIFLFSFLISPVLVHAEIVINEIMYDVSGSDSGREWVEVYNNGSSPVDISGWKFLENPTASNHGFTVVSGSGVIPAGGFAVISNDSTKFMTDWPAFSGNLLKASFSSLSNTSATIVLKDDSLNVIDQALYTFDLGANGDGNSLQRFGSSWIPGLPTPGTANSSASATTTPQTSGQATTTSQTSNSSTNNTVSSNESAHSSPAAISETGEKIKFEISSGRDRLTTVGNKLAFKAVATKLIDLSEQGVSYEWSFGDGTTASGNAVTHSYRFPGEYIVILNGSVSDKQAVGRLTVTVISPDLTLARVAGGVEIWNRSKSEINLDSWTLLSDKKSFVFPKDTLILPSKKIVFADEVTSISSDEIQLVNPLGKEIAVVKKNVLAPIVLALISGNATTTPIIPDVAMIKSKIAALNKQINDIVAVSAPIDAPLIIVPEIKSKLPVAVKVATSSTKDLSQVAASIQVFEAPANTSAIRKILSWPVKGYNFVKHLFVEN